MSTSFLFFIFYFFYLNNDGWQYVTLASTNTLFFFFFKEKKINLVIKQQQIFAYAKRQNVPTWAHGFQMKIRSYNLCFFKCHMALHIDLQYKFALS